MSCVRVRSVSSVCHVREVCVCVVCMCVPVYTYILGKAMCVGLVQVISNVFTIQYEKNIRKVQALTTPI